MLTVTERKIRNITVLELRGRIVIDTIRDLRNRLKSLLDRGERAIILNLEAVPYMDSSGLGELASSHSSIYNLGGQIKLTGLNDKVQRLVEVSMLHTVFDIFRTEEEALSSFRD